MALVRLRKGNEINPWSVFGDFESQLSQFLAPLRGDSFGSTWVPAIDLKETTTGYVLEADVPGLDKENIHVELVENVVTIKGERKTEGETRENGYRHVERSHGVFQRSVELPGPVNADGIRATFENGVLTVNFPKQEEARVKRIEVQAN